MVHSMIENSSTMAMHWNLHSFSNQICGVFTSVGARGET